jgi:hypothetical protein
MDWGSAASKGYLERYILPIGRAIMPRYEEEHGLGLR